MKRFFSIIKYPRLLILLISIIVAYILFAERNLPIIQELSLSLGYLGLFLAGFFYGFGETAAPATAILLIIAKDYNLVFACIITALGALLSDILIFLFIKKFFLVEIKRLSKNSFFKLIKKEEKIVFGRFQKYFILILSCIFIASPLPTEIGVSMMASIKKLSLKRFAIIAFILHTFGIFIILLISRII